MPTIGARADLIEKVENRYLENRKIAGLTPFSYSTFDSAGRVSGVSTIGFGGGFTQYASNLQYRASGAAKSVSFGNNTSASFGFNSRLQLTSYSLSGANYSGTPAPIASSYQYYNDGQIKFAQDQASAGSIIDRAYQYDHASRLKEAYSGTEARDFVNNTSVGTTDGPYRQSNTYDAWNNALTSGGRFWTRSVTETASYNESNRNPNWSYDAEGNLLSRNEMMGNTFSASSSYDASGRRTSVAQTRPCWLEPQHQYQLHMYANTQTYDGDGQMTRHEQSHRIGLNGPHGDGSPQITYYLRSTVLGGRVISEYDGSDGQTTWSLTYVYAGGQRIGTLSWYGQGLPRNYWRQNDPITGDEVTTVENGEISSGTAFDPNGVDVGVQDPFPPLSEEEGVCVNYDPNYIPSGPEPPLLNPLEDGSANCIIDGIEQRCLSSRSEATVQCAENDCDGYSPGARDGAGSFVRFRAFADGYEGYLTTTQQYLGDGMVFDPSTNDELAGLGRLQRTVLRFGARLEAPQNPVPKPPPAPTPDKGDPRNPCSNYHLAEMNREMRSIAREVGGRYDPKLGTITRLGNLNMADAVRRFQSAGFQLFFSFNWNVHPGANLQRQWMNGQHGDTHYYHVTVEPSRYITTTAEVRSAARDYAPETRTVTVPDPSAAPSRITIHCDSGSNYSLRHIWYDYFQMRWP